MPVRKFRSVSDLPGAQPRTPLDPDNLRLACSLTQLAYWLHPMKHVPGVRKYRSAEEAWQARKEWVRSQLRRPGGSVPAAGGGSVPAAGGGSAAPAS